MKIEILFKEYCNLYGDIGNINYLEKLVNHLNQEDEKESKEENKENKKAKHEIIFTGIKDEIQFVKQQIDFVYIGSLSETKIDKVVNKLSEVKDKIKAKLDEGQIFLATGNAIDLFGQYILLDKRYIDKNLINEPSNLTTLKYFAASETITKENLEKIPEKYKQKCLGIFDYIAISKMLIRHNEYVLAKMEDIKLVGFKSSFTQIYNFDENLKMAEVIRGCGNNSESISEGIRYNNFFATYILGPFLIINPEFTKQILQKIGINSKPYLYDELFLAYLDRLAEFEDPSKDLGEFK